MLGVIVCTHSDFADGIRKSVEMILGEQECFDVVCFQEGEDMLALSDRVKEITEKYRQDDEKYIVCVDLFGAPPFNASSAALAAFDTSVITGVNLPMLLQIMSEREDYEDYDALLEGALSNAKENMKIVKMKEMFG